MNKFIVPKIASKIHNIISFGFPKTFFVGGAVRNFLLGKKIIDVDIATSATPKQIIKLLEQNKIKYNSKHAKFGVIIAEGIEITTFRKDHYSASRYPTVVFTRSAKTDSIRRDFTINALYYNPITKELLDFYGGTKDIKKRLIRFIGDPAKRITEDPLRIVRAYRFSLQYKLKFAKETEQALKLNMHLLKNISQTRLAKEINCLASKNLQKQLQKVIHNIY